MASADVERLELHSGDRMTQAEFHRIYERMPANFRAELIGGTVYVSSPVSIEHSSSHPPLSMLFCVYKGATPGVEVGDNGTVVLGEKSELQPDLYLRILPEFGGQSRTEQGYVVGGPELMTEIAVSSTATDLHGRKDDYARHAVREYLVHCVRERRLRWFDLPADAELVPDVDGVIRSRCFPGLWIHVEALLAQDIPQLLATLQQGLAAPEHAEFVRRLAAQRTS